MAGPECVFHAHRSAPGVPRDLSELFRVELPHHLLEQVASWILGGRQLAPFPADPIEVEGPRIGSKDSSDVLQVLIAS